MTWLIVVILIIGAVIIWEYVRQDEIKKKAFNYAQSLAKNKGILNLGAGIERSRFAKEVAYSPQVRANVDVVYQKAPKWIVWDANKRLPFSDRSFDVVFVSHTLEHLKNWEFAIEEALRVGDKVVIVFPPSWAISNWLHPDHKKIWFIGEMKELEKKYPGRIKIFY